MTVALSQLAWNKSAEAETTSALAAAGLRAIEGLPNRLEKSVDLWRTAQLKPVALQALFFGQPEWNLFDQTQAAMLAHLDKIFSRGAQHDITNYVFGSPRQRLIPAGMNDVEANQNALNFFFKVGEIAQKNQVFLCLETVPTHYEANFLTTTAQTISFLKELNHPHVRLNLDTGAMLINGESPASIVTAAAGYIQHVHLSEPDLKPVKFDAAFHTELAQALKHSKYHGVCSIEMKPTSMNTQENISKLILLINQAQEIYGN